MREARAGTSGDGKGPTRKAGTAAFSIYYYRLQARRVAPAG